MERSALRAALARFPAAAADVLIVVVVALVSIVGLREVAEADARAADALAYGLCLAMAAILLIRRNFPLLVLASVAALGFVYYGMGYTGGPPNAALYVAIYSAAAAGQAVPSLALALLLGLGAAAYRIVVEGDPLFAGAVVFETVLALGAFLLGDAVHSRRRWQHEADERSRRAASEREAEARRRVAEERLRIAQDLHDVVAHTLTAMMVQAGVAADALDDDPPQARRALGAIRAAGVAAVEELAASVQALRGGTVPRAPAPGIRDIGGLVAGARAAGLQVDVVEEGLRVPLPAAVDLTAYRVVQESLTNVVRHAEASCVAVRLSYAPDVVVVSVVDDGRGGNHRVAPSGYGLTGMRERVLAIGGSLVAGNAQPRGFRVVARLPMRQDDALSATAEAAG